MSLHRDHEPEAPRLPLPMVAGIVLAALVAHVALAWLARPPGIMTGQDDAQYLMLAQSLRHGGYHEVFRVDRPVHALYPPGYPAMLALWGWLAGDRYDALVALGVGLSAISLLLWFLALRRRVPPAVALSTVVLLAVNPDLTKIAGTISSEIGYLALSVLALFFLAGRTRGDHVEPTGDRWLVLAGAAAVFASLTRVVGVTLLAAVTLHWILERRWRPAGGLVLAATVTVGAWLIWTAVAPDQHEGVSYAADFLAGFRERPWIKPLPGRIPQNITFYAHRFLFSIAVPNFDSTAMESVVALVVLGVALGVGVAAMLTAWRPAALYAVIYAGLLSMWTWRESRYYAPLVAVVVPTLLFGVFSMVRRVRPAWAEAVTVGLAVLLGSVALTRSIEQARRYRGCDRGGEMPPAACLTVDQATFFDALRWVREHTPEDAIVLTAKYAPFYYYTGRRTISYRGALARDSVEFLPFLASQKASWVLVSSLLGTEFSRLSPRLLANCRRLTLEHHFPPHAYLFRIAPAADSAGEREACRAVEEFRAAGRNRRD